MCVGNYVPVNTQAYTMWAKFTIAFPGNPGGNMQLNINTNLDGNRATLYSQETVSTLQWFIFNNGFYGENVDYTPDLCEGVLTNLNSVNLGANVEQYTFLDGLTTAEVALLKACLGDANGKASDNVDVYNWDYGDAYNPHLIKLIDATQSVLQYADNDPTHYVPTQYQASYLCRPNFPGDLMAGSNSTANSAGVFGMCERLNPPGFYAAIFWDNTAGRFKMFGRPSVDYAPTTPFHIFTTTGHLNLVSDTTSAFNTWGTFENYLLTNKLFTTTRAGLASRDSVACETSAASARDCVNKGDWIMVLNTGNNYNSGAYGNVAVIPKNYISNPIYPQLYKVQKISTEQVPYTDYNNYPTYSYAAGTYSSFMRNQIVLDKVLNAEYHLDGRSAYPWLDTTAAIFKFYPPVNQYEYAAQCSNRGICDKAAGTCSCFGGFTGDNCANIDALAH